MKIRYIDGLKGICCIIVSLGHMSALLLPALYFGAGAQSHVSWSHIFYETPLGMFFNSSSALFCFLMLSGFLVPLKAFTSGRQPDILPKWIGRYFRFLPMAIIGTFAAWLVMKAGLNYSYRITDLSYSIGYADIYNAGSAPGFLSKTGPVIEGCLKVFLSGSYLILFSK